jgi:xylulokinase
VTLAGHDHLAALAGSGAAPLDLGNSVGTAETVVGRADRLPDVGLALALRAAVTLAPTGESWAVFASAARAGSILDAAARSLGRSPAELDDMAEGAGAVDVSDMVQALGAGQDPGPAPGTPGETWNGLLAMLVARTADAEGRALELLGPARRLVVFGGGSRSRPWARAKAGACRLPVWRSTAGEAAARGAALYAGVAAGWWPSTGQAPPVALEEVER